GIWTSSYSSMYGVNRSGRGRFRPISGGRDDVLQPVEGEGGAEGRQNLRRGVPPRHRARIGARGMGRLDVAGLVADTQGLAGRHPGAADDLAELARLAEQAGAAVEVIDQGGVGGTQDAAQVGLGIGADGGDANASSPEVG